MRRKHASNAEIAKALREMALFLEMDGVPFKPQAYEKAAYAVLAMDRPLAEIHAEGGAKALDALPGIGKGIAERIAGLLETGRLADLEALRKQTPIDVLGLTAGASAPETLVDELIAHLRTGFSVTVEEVRVAEEDIVFRLPSALATV